MGVTIGRVVLGICAVLAVLGGMAHVAMIVVRFGADEFVPELNEIGWFGALAGMCALAIFVGGAFRANLALRIVVALVLAVFTSTVFGIIATIISMMGDRGGERGTLEDGAVGSQWLLVAAFVLWRVVAGRWPVRAAVTRQGVGSP